MNLEQNSYDDDLLSVLNATDFAKQTNLSLRSVNWKTRVATNPIGTHTGIDCTRQPTDETKGDIVNLQQESIY